MRIFLVRLLWAFDIAEEDGNGVDWDSQKTLNVISKEPQNLRIKATGNAMLKDGNLK